MKKLPSLVFFGSGPVAAQTLDGLLAAGFSFEAIITKPRPVGHRGSVPVLELAEEHRLSLHLPQTRQELTDLFSKLSFGSTVGLVVDYGIIIAPKVIAAFELGIVNSHFSRLPEWRGADPITFALLSGQKQTGVSLMLIVEKLDEGPLLAQATYDIPAEVTISKLTHELTELSTKLIIRELPRYLLGEIKPYPQPNIPSTYSRKLTKADGILDQTKPAAQLEREVRAFLDWPKTRATIFTHEVIVLRARVVNGPRDQALVLPCGDQTWLEILELTAPSGKRMSGEAFVRGYTRLI